MSIIGNLSNVNRVLATNDALLEQLEVRSIYIGDTEVWTPQFIDVITDGWENSAIPQTGGSYIITVKCSHSFKLSEKPTWVTMKYKGSDISVGNSFVAFTTYTFKITVKSNTSNTRTGSITFSATDIQKFPKITFSQTGSSSGDAYIKIMDSTGTTLSGTITVDGDSYTVYIASNRSWDIGYNGSLISDVSPTSGNSTSSRAVTITFTSVVFKTKTGTITAKDTGNTVTASVTFKKLPQTVINDDPIERP